MGSGEALATLYRVATLALNIVVGTIVAVVGGIVAIIIGLVRLMFSVVKFILVMAVLGLVFALFGLVRLGQGLSRPARHKKSTGNKPHARESVDLRQCPRCKAWVAGECEACAAK